MEVPGARPAPNGGPLLTPCCARLAGSGGADGQRVGTRASVWGCSTTSGSPPAASTPARSGRTAPRCAGAPTGTSEKHGPAGDGDRQRDQRGRPAHVRDQERTGTSVCWGDDFAGQTTVPGEVGAVTAIGTGDVHSCAIETDGTPDLLGQRRRRPVDGAAGSRDRDGDQRSAARTRAPSETDGRADVLGRERGRPVDGPAGRGRVTAITAGVEHTCAIRTNGAPTCWGRRTPTARRPGAARRSGR